MSTIKKFSAKEIMDSRGNPTLLVSCELAGGAFGEASVPSGKSTGRYEALELRDNDPNLYRGLGVSKALNNVNTEINTNLEGKEFNQTTLDSTLVNLDGTQNKSRLGANAILGVSLAFARACSKENKVELYEYFGGLVGKNNFKLPQPLLNIINGGKHSNSGLDLQEFMIVPMNFDSFGKKIDASKAVIKSLRKILEEKNYSTSLGDEGGFAPVLSSNEEALELIEQAIIKAGYSFDDIKIGIDAASSSFFEDGSYNIKVSGKREILNSSKLIDWYESLVTKHPIVFIEDPLSEDDFDGFTEITKRLGTRIKIVGDDLTVTNPGRIQKAIDNKSINSVLIKLNQIGTVSETLEAVKMTELQNWSVFISHRSGETLDTTIADLAVGLSAQFIKAGSLTKAERVCKYDRLIEIEEILNQNE